MLTKYLEAILTCDIYCALHNSVVGAAPELFFFTVAFFTVLSAITAVRSILEHEPRQLELNWSSASSW